MHVSRADVKREYEWVRARGETVAPLANAVREGLAEIFEVEVAPISIEQYEDVVDEVFADGARAVNVATLTALLRDLDVEDDYPGFVVDELLARELAGIIGGGQPHRLLAEATFHYADLHSHSDGPAGEDDLDAALAAGVQTRLPGWQWTETDPFDVLETDEKS